MSVQATSWVWEDKSTTGVTRLVLLAIADGANREGERSCQSAKTLASMAGTSERTVWRCIKALEAAGTITKTGIDGHYQTSVYSLTGMTSRQGDGTSGGDNRSPIGVPNQAVVVPPSGRQPHLTPKDNPSSNRSSRIRDDFTPSDSSLVWAQENVPDIDLELETKQFIDHHAGKGSMMVSWDRAWMTWMRNQQRWSKPKAAARPPARTTSDKMRATIEMGRRLQEQQNGIAS